MWEIDPHFGAKVHNGAHGDAVRRSFALLRGVDPRSLYREIEKTGTENVSGAICTVLRLQPTSGKPDTWFVDAEANVVRVDTALPAPESADAGFEMPGLMPTQITFADFQAEASGRMPRQRSMRMGPATVVSTITKVSVGEAVDAAVFVPLKSVTALPNAPVGPALDPMANPTTRSSIDRSNAWRAFA